MRVDAVVLDVDGVLVGVEDSYRRAIIETVDRLYGETIEKAGIQAFKNAGRFNNDWEVTDAVALFVLAKRRGFQMDLPSFTSAIATRGGGIDAARAIIRESGLAVEDEWNPKVIRRVFQQLYLGSNLYHELEGQEPTIESPGYIHDEPVLIEADTIDWLTGAFAVGVFTGRPAAEAAIALERVGLAIPAAHRITMDDEVPGKPDPAGLLRLADRLDAATLAFVGDTIDDIATVSRARTVDDRSYVGIGVLTGGLTGESGRDGFREAGADAVVSTVNDLPEILTPE